MTYNENTKMSIYKWRANNVENLMKYVEEVWRNNMKLTAMQKGQRI